MKTWGTILGYLLLSTLLLVTLQTTSTVQAAGSLEVNIFQPGAAYNVPSLKTYQQNLGVTFYSAKWYQDWGQPFDGNVAKNFSANGFLPELTWQPQANGIGIPYNDVTAGAYDTYLNQTAQQVKATGVQMRISLAPEMNGDWSPWYVAGGSNTNLSHKAFYQYVVQKFRDNGVTNVTWIWAPNVHTYGEPYTFAQIYPGDAYVDLLGLDGYNWGATRTWSTWQTFSQVYGSSYTDLVAISSRPIVITEIASTEVGGSKASWITDMYTSIRTSYPRIQGFTWFNENKETDWRIESSSTSRQAFINGYLGLTSTVSPSPSATPSPTATTKPKKNSKSSTSSQSVSSPSPSPVTTPLISQDIQSAAILPTSSPILSASPTPVTISNLNERSIGTALIRNAISPSASDLKNFALLSLFLLMELGLAALLFLRCEKQADEIGSASTTQPVLT